MNIGELLSLSRYIPFSFVMKLKTFNKVIVSLFNDCCWYYATLFSGVGTDVLRTSSDTTPDILEF